MNVLVLGGTQFVGRHIVERLLANGHNVTLFHRGKTNPDLFPTADHVHGDRKESLSALDGRTWDAVIDTCAYIPREVRIAGEALQNRAKHYLFISTISIYADFSEKGINEDSRKIVLDDPTVEEVNGDTYGGLKVLCEEEFLKQFGEANCAIVRPGIVFGPHDHTDRFNYWVGRGMDDDQVLTPHRTDQPSQWIDARDLAEFTVKLMEDGETGAYNAVGPEEPVVLDELLDAVGIDPSRRVPVGEGELQKHEVRFPLTLPEDGSMDGIFMIDTRRGQAKGLKFRSLGQTTLDVQAWLASREDKTMKAGPAPQKERDIIDAISG